MVNPVDDRSSTAKSLAKADEIFTICLTLLIPGLVGYFVDKQFGTGVVFLVIGMILGLFAAGYHLYRLVLRNQESFAETDLSKIVKYDDADESDDEEDDWDKVDHDH